MLRVWVVLVVLLGTAIGFVGGYAVGRTEERMARLEDRVATLEAGSAPPAVAAAPLRQQVPVRAISLEGAPRRGAEDARVTIVEFSDFQCPYCARAQETLATLLSEYEEHVSLAFKHYPLPIHPDARLAHRAALAAGRQDRFWEMHDAIFQNVRDLSEESLLKKALVLGLDVTRFEKDLADPGLRTAIEEDLAEGRALGIRGTPAFFVNGELISGAQPIEQFRASIERALNKPRAS